VETTARTSIAVVMRFSITNPERVRLSSDIQRIIIKMSRICSELRLGVARFLRSEITRRISVTQKDRNAPCGASDVPSVVKALACPVDLPPPLVTWEIMSAVIPRFSAQAITGVIAVIIPKMKNEMLRLGNAF
jgi:hypothetical protein